MIFSIYAHTRTCILLPMCDDPLSKEGLDIYMIFMKNQFSDIHIIIAQCYISFCYSINPTYVYSLYIKSRGHDAWDRKNLWCGG